MGIVELKLLLQGQWSILLKADSPASCILRLQASRSAPRVRAPASRACGDLLSISTAYSTCDIFAASAGGARRRQILRAKVARRGFSACVMPHHVLPALVHHGDARLARYLAGACSPRHRHARARTHTHIHTHTYTHTHTHTHTLSLLAPAPTHVILCRAPHLLQRSRNGKSYSNGQERERERKREREGARETERGISQARLRGWSDFIERLVWGVEREDVVARSYHTYLCVRVGREGGEGEVVGEELMVVEFGDGVMEVCQ